LLTQLFFFIKIKIIINYRPPLKVKTVCSPNKFIQNSKRKPHHLYKKLKIKKKKKKKKKRKPHPFGILGRQAQQSPARWPGSMQTEFRQITTGKNPQNKSQTACRQRLYLL
jgi:hypothetical protein